jgi:Sulfatase
MRQSKNILFIMCDQLRFDYLSCYGHPRLCTPNVDALAANGVRFTRAYVQSPVCGASRMSFYTGRYVQSHGASWNGVPLKVGEMTLGDYLRPLGVRTVLVGKTHMRADREGMQRLGSASTRSRSSACAWPSADSIRSRATMACTGSGPTAATIRRRRVTTAISTTTATPGTIPGTIGPTPRRGTATGWPRAGPCAMRTSPRA